MCCSSWLACSRIVVFDCLSLFKKFHFNFLVFKKSFTSCSAPVVGGLLTYVWNTLWIEHKKKLGFANPLLYYIKNRCSECYNDITIGYNWCTEGECCKNKTNYGFSAREGFDPVTGLGSLNIDKITRFIKTNLR